MRTKTISAREAKQLIHQVRGLIETLKTSGFKDIDTLARTLKNERTNPSSASGASAKATASRKASTGK